MKEKSYLSPLRLGSAAAIVGAIAMGLIWTFPRMGMYQGAATMMGQWHMYFGLTPIGLLTGAIEGAIHGFIGGYVLALLYNKLDNLD